MIIVMYREVNKIFHDRYSQENFPVSYGSLVKDDHVCALVTVVVTRNSVGITSTVGRGLESRGILKH